MGIEDSSQAELTWRHLGPGVVYIALIDILAVAGWLDSSEWLARLWTIPLVVLPWGLILASKGRLKLMGFHRKRWLLNLGWGFVAGGLWRMASLAFNLALTQTGEVALGWGGVVSGVLLVPWIEETFFRGYLGRGLAIQWGKWPGILIQSTLFAFHPVHWAQGWPHLISIFGFGCLAGWLVERRRSIWAAWGAHAFANLIPLALPFFV